MIDGVVVIHMASGRQTLVSGCHLQKLLTLKTTWYAEWYESDNTYFVKANLRKSDGRWTHIRLHRFITECSDDEYVLHLDNDGLNNIDKNLVVTSRNRTGAKLRREFTSGVGFDYERLMWYAVVNNNGRNEHVGYFLSEAKANEIFQQYNISDV